MPRPVQGGRPAPEALGVLQLTIAGEALPEGILRRYEEAAQRAAASAAEMERLLADARGPEPLAYSVRDASAVSGIGRTSMYREIAAGRLPAKKRGSDTLILRRDLIAYLDLLANVDGSKLYQR